MKISQGAIYFDKTKFVEALLSGRCYLLKIIAFVPCYNKVHLHRLEKFKRVLLIKILSGRKTSTELFNVVSFFFNRWSETVKLLWFDFIFYYIYIFFLVENKANFILNATKKIKNRYSSFFEKELLSSKMKKSSPF